MSRALSEIFCERQRANMTLVLRAELAAFGSDTADARRRPNRLVSGPNSEPASSPRAPSCGGQEPAAAPPADPPTPHAPAGGAHIDWLVTAGLAL